jgi:hypothetical protein
MDEKLDTTHELMGQTVLIGCRAERDDRLDDLIALSAHDTRAAALADLARGAGLTLVSFVAEETLANHVDVELGHVQRRTAMDVLAQSGPQLAIRIEGARLTIR